MSNTAGEQTIAEMAQQIREKTNCGSVVILLGVNHHGEPAIEKYHNLTGSAEDFLALAISLQKLSNQIIRHVAEQTAGRKTTLHP